jgi:hypothetical protein
MTYPDWPPRLRLSEVNLRLRRLRDFRQQGNLEHCLLVYTRH